MIDVTSAFLYEDHLTGKILINREEELDQPYSRIFKDVYDDRFVDFIDQMVDRAREGNFLSRVDALMTLSYFLKRKWPMPDSLSLYISEVVQGAVIAFGHTEGRVEKKKAATCSALGLVMRKGAPLTEQKATKRLVIHSYIWWKMAIDGDSLYLAAQCAVKAFRKTGGISHDGCEKMYTAQEAERSDNQETIPSLRAFLALKIYPANALDHYGMVFKDNDFLCKIAPHLEQEGFQAGDITKQVEQFISTLENEGLTVQTEMKLLNKGGIPRKA